MIKSCYIKFSVINILFFIFSTIAVADCSATKVQRLSNKGASVSDIAETCEMSKRDVLDALKDDNDEQEENGNPDNSPGGQSSRIRGNRQGGAPSGTVLAQCGCWGFEAGNQRKDPRCESGYSAPQACAYYCPAGGYAWGVVCM
ncbi:hypothetical protein PL263_03990 [Methylomonas sp. EFPC3]|uniref:hypothetical protein n=1 Tax=Methylomonas sp. EFPC3 TaxID=3021710 RepID=UPI002416F43B|nr:hypothetical protein [Methylomonas sp. EFPC3]WFP51193.1 hypothetical protein PL263_03990 [Methylomonas sp. EFPC3]